MKARLGDLTKIKTGKLDANAASLDGAYPFFTCSKDPLRIADYSYDCECVLVAGNGDLNVKYYNGKFDAYQRTYIVEDNGSGRLHMPYLYYFMDGYVEELRRQSIGGVIKYIKLGNLTNAMIELPDIEIQKFIVSLLSKTKDVIYLRQQQLEKLDELVKARFVEMFGEPLFNTKGWMKMPLVKAAPIKALHGNLLDKIWLLNLDAVESQTGTVLFKQRVQSSEINASTVCFTTKNVLYSKLRPYLNKVVLPDEDGIATSEMIPLCPQSNILNRIYLCYWLRSDAFVTHISEKVAGAKMPRVSMDYFRTMFIELPPIELQNQFAAFVTQVDKSKVVVQKEIKQLIAVIS